MWINYIPRVAPFAATMILMFTPSAFAQPAPAPAERSLAAELGAPVDLSGVWEMKFREYVRTDDGKDPPLRPEALKQYQLRTSKLKAGEQLSDSATACLPHGTPRIMYTPYPVLIAQRPNLVAFMFEVNHNIRVAYLGEAPPEDPDPTYLGSTVAHWEGKTLVMETTGLNDKIQIDRAGLPQSEKTKIVERLTMVDNDQTMQVKVTVIDDTLYTAPWSFTHTWKRANYHIMEYVCENNRQDFAP